MDQMINIFENEEFGSVRTMKEENGSVVFCVLMLLKRWDIEAQKTQFRYIVRGR